MIVSRCCIILLNIMMSILYVIFFDGREKDIESACIQTKAMDGVMVIS